MFPMSNHLTAVQYLPIAFLQGLLPWEKIFLESHIPTLLSSGISDTHCCKREKY